MVGYRMKIIGVCEIECLSVFLSPSLPTPTPSDSLEHLDFRDLQVVVMLVALHLGCPPSLQPRSLDAPSCPYAQAITICS